MTPSPQRPSPGAPAPKRKTAGFTSLALLALASAAGLAAADATAPAAKPTPAAAAADDDTVKLDEYIVSGLRGSAIKAIELKKENPQFTDSIVAEDIGKFPDNNIVESLQRLPGVQVTDYGAGNITSVTIRGLPDVTTTLNGRNIFTASGLSLSLQDVPASLLRQVDVMKTRAASHIESGMAGVLDIQTFRPFDFSGQKISVAAKTTYNEQRDAYDPNISVLFSNRWKFGAEGSVGLLLNASYLTTTYRDQSATPGAQVPFAKGAQPAPAWPEPYARLFPDVVPWTPGLDDGLPTAPGSKLAGTVEYVLARDAIFFNETKGKTKRPAFNLSFQFAPTKSAEYTFEAFYLGYRSDRFSNLLFSFVDWWGSPSAATLDVTLYPGTNIVKRRGYVGDVFSFTSGDYITGKTDSMQYSLGGKWTISPDFTLRAEGVIQDSKFNGTNFFIRGNRNVRNDVTVDFNAGNGVPAFKYLDVAATTGVNESDVANPATWSLAHMWDQGFRNKGNASTFTGEGLLNVDWGWVKKLRFGLRVDDRGASEAARFAEGDPITGTTLAALNTARPGIVSVNSGFFDGRAAIPTSWASINGAYANANAVDIRKLYSFQAGSRWNLKESFNIDEITTAGYAQVDRLETEFDGHKLTGQFGLRFVNIATRMAFTSTATNSSNITYGNAGVSKLLPSASFSYEITKNLIARAGYGETIRRPGFNDLNPLITYARDVTNIGYGTASGGNPDLKPTESKNIDLALEYYLDDSTVVHVAYFDRKIEGLVVGSRRRVTYTDAIGPYDYILSQPLNASNGKLDGFEIGAKYYPKELPGFLQGFGIEGSYTHLKSSQNVPITNSAGVITGTRQTQFFLVSPDSWSATLAYERGRLSARASYAWRSAFHHHNEAPLFANPLPVYNAAERSVTAQISYKLAENLVLTLEGTNLTDDIQHSYYGANGSTVHNFGNWIVGRTVSVGARYSF